MNKTVGYILIALVVLGGGYWYMNSQKTVGEAMPESESMMEKTDTMTEFASPSGASAENGMMEKAREIVIEGSEFKFSENTMTLKVGEPVKLVFKNTGNMTHDWVVDELGVRTKVISSGQEDTIEFTPNKAGTFEYYCSVGSHRKMGMKGTLTVEN